MAEFFGPHGYVNHSTDTYEIFIDKRLWKQ
jgi:hypothetical protein